MLKNLDYDYCGDRTVNNVVYKHIERAISSNKKHKNTIAERNETVKQWVQEALEEAMDMTVYLQRLLEKLETEEENEQNGMVTLSSRKRK